MGNRYLIYPVVGAAAAMFCSVALCQAPRQKAGIPDDPRPFNQRDLNGVWNRPYFSEDPHSPTCGPECGDRGFNNDVPAFTPEGQKRFDANKPSYGRMIGTSDAAAHPQEHIGRRRALPPALGNDPTGTCNPAGPTRMLIYPDPLEIIQTPTKLLQHFEWTNQWREIWTDGRTAPKQPDLPRWYGYSAGRWEGNTFIVETTGVDPRTWVDMYGYPHSESMRLTERYRRFAYNKLEVIMSIDDPVIYAKPWVSERKVFVLQNGKSIGSPEWPGLLDQTCAPVDEVEQFNNRIRDPVGGVRKQ